MARIFATIIMVCSAVLLFAAGGPVLSFENNSVDLGRVSEAGNVVVTEFKFTNTGDTPLVITKAYVSCTCTKIEYPKRPIVKGGSGVIKVKFDPKRQNGTFMKAIQIFSNAATKRDVITIKGEVY